MDDRTHAAIAYQPTRLLVGSDDPLRLAGRSIAIILLYGATLLGIGLGSSRVLSYHETLFVQSAREMMDSGDWVIPTLGGLPFLDKPPLTQWSIGLMMTVFDSRSPWVVRLPAVLSALWTALLLGSLASRWFGNRVGLLAGCMFLSSVYVLMQARLAESDMLFCATVATAMYAFAMANVDSPLGRRTERWWPWLFYVAIGLSVLAKGPLGPAFIFGGTLSFLLVNQDARGLLFFLSPVGIGACLLLTLSWPIMAYVAYPPILKHWTLHHLGRFQGQMGGGKPRLFYFYTIPMLLLPWTPGLFYGLYRGIREGHTSAPIWRFAACWVWPGLLLLTASHWKHKHYGIPLLPPLTMLAAVGLIDLLRLHQRRGTLTGWRTAAIVAACTALAVNLAAMFGKQDAMALAVLLGAIGCGVLVGLYFAGRRQLTGQLVAALATAWVVGVGVQVAIVPNHDSYRGQTDLALRANNAVPGGSPIYLLSLPENQVMFYLERDFIRLDDPARVKIFLPEPGGEIYAMAPQFVADKLADWGRVEVLDRSVTINKYMQERDRITLFRLTCGTDILAQPPADADRNQRR